MSLSFIPTRYSSDKGYDPSNWLWYTEEETQPARESDWIEPESGPKVCVADDTYDTAVDDAIDRSKKILDLNDDWDGEGSTGYSEATLNRATSFLEKHASFARLEEGEPISPPLISPAEAGSIDLYWRMFGRSLLINFPEEPDRLPSYYGDDSNGNTIGGFVSADSIRRDLIAWLNRPL